MFYNAFSLVVVAAAILSMAHAGTIKRNSNEADTVDAYSRIEAERYSMGSSTIYVQTIANSSCLSLIESGDQAVYDAIDFGTGPNRISIRIFHSDETIFPRETIHFILDDFQNIPFHTMVVGATNSQWITVTEYVDYGLAAVGVHDLYVVFENVNLGMSLVDVDWFQFGQ